MTKLTRSTTGDVVVTLGQVAHFERGEFDTGGEGLVPRRVRCTLVAVILTSMRWRQVDFDQKAITIGKAKSVPGTGHVIPMNDELLAECHPTLNVHRDLGGDPRRLLRLSPILRGLRSK
jgi:hypothetical protein